MLNDPMDELPFSVTNHKSELILRFLEVMKSAFYVDPTKISTAMLMQPGNTLGSWGSQLKSECISLCEKVTPFEETDSTKIQVYKECINIIDENLSPSSK
jgi:hypothetical protein